MVLLNSIKGNVKVLEVEGCHSSVVRALVAKASGPGFESPATTKIFSHFSFAFFQTPLGEKVSFYDINFTYFNKQQQQIITLLELKLTKCMY